MSLENEAGDSVNLAEDIAATGTRTRTREHTASFVSNVWAKNDRAAAAGLGLEWEFHLWPWKVFADIMSSTEAAPLCTIVSVNPSKSGYTR